MQIIVETYNNGSPTPEFNNAGQIFNHDFYWESLSPEKREPHQPQALPSMMSVTIAWCSFILHIYGAAALTFWALSTAESGQYNASRP